MTAVDWNAYRKCPACGARIGEACVERRGWLVEGMTEVVVSTTPIETPHGSRQPRKPRTGGVS